MSEQYFSVGDRVQFDSKKGLITGTITNIQSGRKWTSLGITDSDNRLWGYKSVKFYYTTGLKFLGKSDTKTLKKATEKRQELDEKKYENHRKNVDKLWDIKPEIGDTIVIRSNQGNWTAEVDELNYKEGKVGIKKRNSGSSGIEDPMMSMLFGSRKKRVQTHRWIPMNCIVEVKKGTGVKSDDIKPIPSPVVTALKKDRYQKDLEDKGVTQITFTNGEFISSSYAFSETKAPLVQVANYRNYPGLHMYDGPYKQTVKFDSTLKLFWIDTGCFD